MKSPVAPSPRRDSKGIKSHSPRRPRFSPGSVLQLLVAGRGGRWKGRETSIPGTMDSELPTRRSPTGRIANRWRCSTPIFLFLSLSLFHNFPPFLERIRGKFVEVSYRCTIWINKNSFIHVQLNVQDPFRFLDTKKEYVYNDTTDWERIYNRIEDLICWIISLSNINIYTLKNIF